MIILRFHLQPQFKYELFHIYFTSLSTLVSRPEEILESVDPRSLFTMNKHAIANVYLYLSFLLRIMFEKKYFYKSAFTLKQYKFVRIFSTKFKG